MVILVSPNEKEVRVELDRRGIGIEHNLPYDFQLITSRGKVLAERKRFPEDFVASVQDGRMAKECAAMRQDSSFRFLIVEGKGNYDKDNRLFLGGRSSRWTKSGIRNLYRSIRFVEGIDIEFTDSIVDTVDCLVELQHYFDTENHVSLRNRQTFESNWLIPVYEEQLTYFYQGLPGIKIVRARKLSKEFPNPMNLFSATVERLKQVDGIGDKLASGIYGFLRGESG